MEAPDSHHYHAAWGWLELGNHSEARAEFTAISPANRAHPAVLDLHWSICAAEKDWSEAYRAAQELVAALPDEPGGWLHGAYALRRMPGGGLEQAWNYLQPQAERFPAEPVIAFNLACYACQLNQLDEARRWLQQACAVGEAKKIRAMALLDEDLQKLWPEIRTTANRSTD